MSLNDLAIKTNKLQDQRTQLSYLRTKLANNRTFLSYMRTGFVITGVAEIYKKRWFVFFGIFMLLISSIQYYIINDYLDKKIPINNTLIDIIPFMYVLLGLGVFYLQTNKKYRINR